MAPKPWNTLTTREVYKNKWMRLREDLAEMPNGKTTIYGVCEFGQCVGVLPFVDDTHVVMVRQYRYVFGENHRWEMPTGGWLPAETFEEAAQRELCRDAERDQLPSSCLIAKSAGQPKVGRNFHHSWLKNSQARA